MPGVVTTAPPIPNMPESTPDTNADRERQCELERSGHDLGG